MKIKIKRKEDEVEAEGTDQLNKVRILND